MDSYLRSVGINFDDEEEAAAAAAANNNDNDKGPGSGSGQEEVVAMEEDNWFMMTKYHREMMMVPIDNALTVIH